MRERFYARPTPGRERDRRRTVRAAAAARLSCARYRAVNEPRPGISAVAATRDVEVWIRAVLRRRALEVAGRIEQVHARPWSRLLRVPTTGGVVYFKATPQTLLHEPALTNALAAWRPDCIPAPFAVDRVRGWMLIPYAGECLRGLPMKDHLGHWEAILPVYAGVQVDMVSRTGDLLALGALDYRLERFPRLYAELLSDVRMLGNDRSGRLTAAEYGCLRAHVPHVAAMCRDLAAYQIPETVNHDDLHDGNVLARDGEYAFLDWAESSITHPFFTMVVTLRAIAQSFRLPLSSPQLARLRDIYLDGWKLHGSPENLRAAFELAQRLGKIGRALTCQRIVAALEPPVPDEDAGMVPEWLREWIGAAREDGMQP